VRASLRLAAAVLCACSFAACRSRDDKVADLLADLRSPDIAVADQAVRQFVMMGEPAVPALIPALKDPEPRVRTAAASALWGLGPKARTAVAALAETLADPALAEVRGALLLLGAEEVRPARYEAIRDFARQGAAVALS